jgi:hypothetical protein
MTIHSDTTIQAYRLNKGGVRARMSILKMISAESKIGNKPPSLAIPDWRAARHWGFDSYESAYATMSAGQQNGTSVWYSHAGPEFRNERFADECSDGPDHRGWYTRENGETGRDGSGLARGIVACLPHGRFIAGYHWGDNDERVYFPEVFTDEGDAVRAADEHARVFAESTQEDNARFNRMESARGEVENAEAQLADWRALRRAGRRDTGQVCEVIQMLREAREELEIATREYEGA